MLKSDDDFFLKVHRLAAEMLRDQLKSNMGLGCESAHNKGLGNRCVFGGFADLSKRVRYTFSPLFWKFRCNQIRNRNRENRKNYHGAVIHVGKVTTIPIVSSKFVNYDSIFGIGEIGFDWMFNVVEWIGNRPGLSHGTRSNRSLAVGIEAIG